MARSPSFFTDIEDSTRLLHELGTEAYSHSLTEHRRVLREAFKANAEQVALRRAAACGCRKLGFIVSGVVVG